MADLLRRKTVKARKAHTCQGCAKTIVVGENATVSVVVGSDGICSFYECDPCREWAESKCDNCKDFDYCIGENYTIGSIAECKIDRMTY